MESLAFIHNAVAYESNEPLPELRPLPLQWEVPSSAWIATSSLVVSLLIIGVQQQAIAAVTGVVDTGGASLNVRNSPDGNVVGTVANGTTLELTGRAQGGWLEKTDGTWVMAQYVQSAPTETAQAPQGSSSQVAYARTNGAPLNVRSEPNGSVVGTVPNGGQVELTGRSSNGWLERSDGTWIAAQYVQSTPPSPASSTATTPATSPSAVPSAAPSAVAASPSPAAQGNASRVGYVQTGGDNPLNYRRSPGGEVVGRVPNGSQVELTGREQNGWLERTDGTWVQAQFIQFTPPAPATQQATASPSPAPATAPASPAPAAQAPATPPASPAPAAQAPSTPAQGSSARTATVRTNGSPLLVRSAPAGSVVGSLPNGSVIELSGRSNGQWVERTNNTWVASNWISTTGTTPPDQGSDVTTAFVRTNGTPLNVRSAPGGAVVGTLPNGTQVELTGRRSGEWAQRTNGTWVSNNWLSTSGGGTNPGDGTGSDASTAFVRTNGTPLNVRSSPGGAVVGTLPNGARVELTGRRSGEWAQRTNGTWVSNNWLSTSGGGTDPGDGTGSDASTAFVSTNGTPLNVRSAPGGAVVGTLPNGARVELTGRRSGEWAQRTNGTWVSNNWLSTSGGSGNVGGPDTIALVNTNGSPLLVRSSPGGSIIGEYANGSRITLNGRTSGGWVQLSNGNWVSGSWVTPVSR